MAVSKIRTDDDLLTGIARALGRPAEGARRLLGALQKNVEVLHGGAGLDGGVESFQVEMSAAVLPSRARLEAALDGAAGTTRPNRRITKQVDSRLDRSGEVAGAKAPVVACDSFGGAGGERPARTRPSGAGANAAPGHRLTPQQLEAWRHAHPRAALQKADRQSSRHPGYSEERLEQAGYYQARADVDADGGIKTEVWLKDGGMGAEIRIQRSWGGDSLLRRVPPGPGYYRDYREFYDLWLFFNPGRATQATDQLDATRGTAITVETFWAHGYHYAATRIELDPVTEQPKKAIEYWIKVERDGLAGKTIQIERPLP